MGALHAGRSLCGRWCGRLATDAAALDGQLLTLRVPAAALAELDGELTWWALTQRDGGYEDRLPDGGADARVPFPADPG